MLVSRLRFTFVVLGVCLAATPAAAQLIPGWDTKQFTFERIDADRIRLAREVEVNGNGPNAGQQIFADELEWNTTTGEFTARGNVLLATATARLSAESVVFNTKSGTGTFYTASGLASLGDRANQEKSMFGTLEPDIYFWGERIEKIGPDKYRLHKGGFTTCVQPSPRWDVVSGSATINLGDYAILRNAVMRVKDVPIFYLPTLYYPIQDDDRATGFLLPTYGRSLYAGQSLSNAFFWAISRSQDLTLLHDWYTKTGQGAGAEYRYIAAPGSEGNLRSYWLSQKQATFENNGATTTSAGGRSYELNGGVTQVLPFKIRARARVDYFSSLTTQQLYNTNIYEASRRQRTYGGSATGTWGGVSVTGNYQRSELFTTSTDSIVNGYAPSVTSNLSSKRLGRLPLYVAVNSELSNVLYTEHHAQVSRDLGLERFDATPTLRAAVSKWPFLNVNASVGYRITYFSESLNDRQIQVPVPLTRQYFDLRTDLVGPVFSKVYTPNNALADRLKHVIEPNFSVQHITDFENLSRVVTAASSYDYVIPGVTRMSYGLTNRILVRKTPSDSRAQSAASAPRELASISITQAYYTDPQASRYDNQYQSSSYNTSRPANSFSPIALTARTTPSALTSGTLRLEYDYQTGTISSFSATGNSNYRSAQVAVGWSTRTYSETFKEDALNASTTLAFKNGTTGGTYLMNWDIARGYIIQQRLTGFYNAQCCGIMLEYQQYNFPSDPRFPIPEDRRFNMSFSLAGIGTFSNFFGAFGGGNGRRY
jgi:lipopolysaccharide assembly outer membrane protein LptD (OstA)